MARRRGRRCRQSVRFAGSVALAAITSLAGCAVVPSDPGVEAGASAEPRALIEIPSERPERPDLTGAPDAVAALLEAEAGHLTTGPDRFAVWVCEVPTDTTSSAYQPAGIRLDLDPAELTDAFNITVTDYFLELSHGAYTPQFEAGGRIELTDTEGPIECIARATELTDDAPGVIAIATAEHRQGTSGGFGDDGASCDAAEPWPCASSVTGRGVYLGASDFHPDWGAVPALDLLEHEIGHVLGWPHSGDLASPYASSIDVMSNSAGPRDVDAAERNGQGTLAVNLLAAGWIPLDDAVVVPAEGSEVTLRPSQSDTGARLAIVPLDATRFLTVEYLRAEGVHGHLPASGVTVTLVSTAESSCASSETERSCRVQETLVGEAPFVDLLAEGESWRGDGWSVEVTALVTDTVELRIAPSP